MQKHHIMEEYNAVVYFAQWCVINTLTSGIWDKALPSVMAMLSSESSQFLPHHEAILHLYDCEGCLSNESGMTALDRLILWLQFNTFLFIYWVGAEDYSGQQKTNRQTDPQRASLTSHMTFVCLDRRTEWKRPASRPMYWELAGVWTNIWDSASSIKDPS